MLIIAAIILIPIIFCIVTYNSIVRLNQMIPESWSNVDTELRRRYDLIPNLVETVKGYAQHEKGVFERIAQARAAAIANHGDPESQAKDENVLVHEMKSLFAVAENYPDLKASQNFLKLQEELTNTEDRIQAARRFYNANVRDFNNKVLTFPSSIIASMGGFKTKNYFEIESIEARQPVSVGFNS